MTTTGTSGKPLQIKEICETTPMDTMKKLFDPVKVSPYEHVITSRQFDEDYLRHIFELTDYMCENEFKVGDILKNRIVALIFYEASTRDEAFV